MIVYLGALLIVILYGLSFENNIKNYLDKSNTNAIKGIFILIVFLNHARSYLDLADGILNKIYSLFFHCIGQMMVVMFLFYSGYGIAYQYQNKTNEYKKSFLKKRILKTWIHFSIAVAIYAIIALIFQQHYSTNQWLFCWIGWESIGNSNWFVFDTLALYIVSYISMIISDKQRTVKEVDFNKFFITIVIGTIVLWGILYVGKTPSRYWYNTLFAFPLGVFYSFYHERIEEILSNKRLYYFSLFGSMILFVLTSFVRNSVGENTASVFFATIIILMSMNINVGDNKVLVWLGSHLFPIYILQRIPMNILRDASLNPVLFVFVCLVVTGFLVYPFEWLCSKVDYLLN